MVKMDEQARIKEDARPPARKGTLSVREGITRLVSLPVSFLGLALFRAWLPLLTDNDSALVLDGALLDIVLAAMLLVLAGAAVIFGRIAPLLGHSQALMGTAAIVLCTSLCILFAPSTPSPVLTGLSTCLVGAVSSLLILLWCELYSTLSIETCAISLALSFIIGEILYALVSGMETSHRTAMTIALPLLSFLCLLRARMLIRLPSKGSTRIQIRSLPWKLFALIGVYYFVSGLCLGVRGMHALSFSGIDNVIAGLTVLIAVLFFGDRLDLSKVCRSPVVLLSAALLLLPFAGGLQGPLAATCTAMSLSVFELAIFLIICDIARTTGLPAMLLFGIEEAAILFRSVGAVLMSDGSPIRVLGAQPNVTLVAAVAIAIVATFLLFRKSELEDRWGVEVMSPGALSHEHAESARIRSLCDLAMRSHGLTAREAEVLASLLRGATLEDIGEQLGVAKGTIKAHCKHIYTKMGVRSRKEMMALIYQNPDRDPDSDTPGTSLHHPW